MGSSSVRPRDSRNPIRDRRVLLNVRVRVRACAAGRLGAGAAARVGERSRSSSPLLCNIFLVHNVRQYSRAVTFAVPDTFIVHKRDLLRCVYEFTFFYSFYGSL